MKKITSTFLTATAVATLLSGSAIAGGDATMPAQPSQPSTFETVYIDQLNLNTAIADLDVHVDGTADSATANSVANGNAATGHLKTGNIDFDAIQTNDGFIRATSTVTGHNVTGTTAVTATAYGNAASSGTWAGDNLHFADQVTNGDVLSRSELFLESSDAAYSTATAGGNISVAEAENGYIGSFQSQSTTWDVVAKSNVALGSNTSEGSFIANANGNSAVSHGHETTSYNGSVQTTDAMASIYAESLVNVHEASNIASTGVASGNSHVVTNEWGYATLGRDGSDAFQGNDASVAAASHVTLGTWNGYASSTAYGVGNTASISNVGADTQLFAIQNNYGAVTTSASLSGSANAGGTGSAVATSIGNNATATLCNMCGDATLSGRVQQNNAANIFAETNIYSAHGGHVSGSATAIGNSATFHSTGD